MINTEKKQNQISQKSKTESDYIVYLKVGQHNTSTQYNKWINWKKKSFFLNKNKKNEKKNVPTGVS